MKILKVQAVIEISSLSHSTLYRLMKANKFPRPLRLSGNRVGWPQDVIYKWLEEKQLSTSKLIEQGGA